MVQFEIDISATPDAGSTGEPSRPAASNPLSVGSALLLWIGIRHGDYLSALTRPIARSNASRPTFERSPNGSQPRTRTWTLRRQRPSCYRLHQSRMVWMERFELPAPCSQSRCHTKLGHIQIAPPRGLEPRPCRLEGGCPIHWTMRVWSLPRGSNSESERYEGSPAPGRKAWYRRTDSNRQPTRFERAASTSWATAACVLDLGFEPRLLCS